MTKVAKFKGVFLKETDEVSCSTVLLEAVFAPNVVNSRELIRARSIPELVLHGFGGQVGEVLSFPSSYLGNLHKPSNLVYFGLGRYEDFTHDEWRVALTTVLLETRHYAVECLHLDLDGVGNQAFLKPPYDSAIRFGVIASESACAVLADAPYVRSVEMWVGDQDVETRRNIEKGIRYGLSPSGSV